MLPPNIRSDSNSPHLHVPEKNYIIDIILLVSCVALLVIGILASSGKLQFMGANADYLSYGMYAGAALFLIVEIVRLIVTCKKNRPNIQRKNKTDVEIERAINTQITKVMLPSKITVPRGVSFTYGQIDCKIQIILANGQARDVTLIAADAYALLQAIDENKWFYESGMKATRLFFDGFGIRPSDKTAKEIFERIVQ